MDSIELLRQLGQVEPADQSVLDAAERRFTESAAVSARAGRRPKLMIGGIGAIVAVAAAVVFALPNPAIRPVSRPAGPPSTPAQSGRTGIAAILTAFAASRNDILVVTKTISPPDEVLGRTVIWVDPVGAGPGTAVRSRILIFTRHGHRLMDLGLSYIAPKATARDCGEVFLRPRLQFPPAPGLPGTATIVYNPQRYWIRHKVAVQAATVPNAGWLGACIKNRKWQDLGPRVLDGRKVIKFAFYEYGYEYLWVDRATDLPVRLVSTNGQNTITFGFRFLPPTPANNVLLAPHIPPGFVRRGI